MQRALGAFQELQGHVLRRQLGLAQAREEGVSSLLRAFAFRERTRGGQRGRGGGVDFGGGRGV